MWLSLVVVCVFAQRPVLNGTYSVLLLCAFDWRLTRVSSVKHGCSN